MSSTHIFLVYIRGLCRRGETRARSEGEHARSLKADGSVGDEGEKVRLGFVVKCALATGHVIPHTLF
jgi:hypothetical protein